MEMSINREVWADSYRFHVEAIQKHNQMKEEPFWEWMAAKVLEIANAHNNDPLTVGLLVAVFEDMEAASKERRNDIITKGA